MVSKKKAKSEGKYKIYRKIDIFVEVFNYRVVDVAAAR